MREVRVRVGEGVVALLAVLLMGWLAHTWAARLFYPYDLEWMEGGMLHHAYRMRMVLPVYGPPAADFTPFVYPPAYPAVLAGVASATGLSPALGRALALFGSLLAAASISGILRRIGASWAIAAGCGVAFLGTYAASGAFMDLVRPDGMYVGLLAASVALALDGRRGTAAASGLLLAACFLTKHNGAAFGVPILLGLLLRDRKQALSFALASLGPALAMVAYMQWRSDGRFLVYLLEVPASHPVVWSRLWPGTVRELGSALPIAVGVSACMGIVAEAKQSRWPVAVATTVPVAVGIGVLVTAILGRFVEGEGVYAGSSGLAAFGVGAWATVGALRVSDARRRSVHPDDVLLVGVVVVAFGLAGIMRAHNGGYLNVHMHLFWAGALAFGWVLARANAGVAAGVLALQLAWSLAIYDGAALRPTPEAEAAGDRLVARLRELPGPVLAPYSAWLPTYAGHPPSVHYMALWDLDHKGGPLVSDLSTLRSAMRAHHWKTAVVANQAIRFGFEEAYGPPPVRLKLGDAMAPRTGWKVYPTGLGVPR